MKKHYFLVLMTVLFLGACDETEDGPVPPVTGKRAGRTVKKPHSLPVTPPSEDPSKAREVELPKPRQAPCRNPLLLCTKGEDTYQYYIDLSQTFVDDPGTNRARARICQLFEKRGKGGDPSTGELLVYAHWERDTCMSGRDAKQVERESEGFSCTCQN